MNSTSTTCQVEVYKDSFWMPIASSISYGIDVIVSAWWFQTIWKDVMNPQTFWTIFKIFHAWIKGLVRILFEPQWYVIHIQSSQFIGWLLCMCKCCTWSVTSLGATQPTILSHEKLSPKSCDYDYLPVAKFHNDSQILCPYDKINSRNGRKSRCQKSYFHNLFYIFCTRLD